MNKKLTTAVILLGLSSTLSSAAFANGWPEFSVLSPERVQQLFVSCGADKVEIPQGTRVKIENRYIPSDETWYWVYTGNSECVQMPKTLKYQSYHLHGDSNTGGSVVTEYGESSHPLFQFTFSYEPGWDCGPFAGTQPPLITGCARDMR